MPKVGGLISGRLTHYGRHYSALAKEILRRFVASVPSMICESDQRKPDPEFSPQQKEVSSLKEGGSEWEIGVGGS